MGKSIHVLGQNALLARLPEKDRLVLLENSQRMPLDLKRVVFEQNRPIRNVYFPLSGVISVVVSMGDGLTVECATVGNEGMAGLALFLGAEMNPYRAFSQVPGEALRIPADIFKRQLRSNSALHQLLQRYSQGLMNQMAYSVACNRLHSVEERMCRWLLMTRDRVDADQFSLTQEFLAEMLGVRRPSVTVVAGVLQKAGLIEYARGRVIILDPVRLEEASCECYRVVRSEYERLLDCDFGA